MTNYREYQIKSNEESNLFSVNRLHNKLCPIFDNFINKYSAIHTN